MRLGRNDDADAPESGSETTSLPLELPGEPAGLSASAALALQAEKTRTPMNRTVWVMALIAVAALVAGLLVGRLVKSPAQIAAESEPPEAGPITVEVERRTLSADVVARGDAVYDDAVEVKLETGDLGGPAVVTGAVPAVGTEVQPGSVLLEVAGRPVIVLPGDLPVFRTLRAGVSGPDVVQLQAALAAVGIDGGTSGTYDAQTASAVAELFTRAGYPAPEPAEGARETLRSAEEGVTSAEQSLASAEAALTKARAGVTQSTKIGLDNAVNSAQNTLNNARADLTSANNSLNAAKACVPSPEVPGVDENDPGKPAVVCSPSVSEAEATQRSAQAAVSAAEGDLSLAQAARTEGLAAPDTTAEVQSRDAAARSLEEARSNLTQAQQDVLTPLPASEVAYLANLPRRVDTVAVERGTVISGPVMTISGATLEIVSNISDADAALLTVGQPATVTVGDEQLPATITEITKDRGTGSGDGSGDGGSGGSTAGRTTVVLHPDALTEEQRTAIVGSNVRVTIPVSSTDAEVLAVPVAALTAGAGGETRLEVLRDGTTTPELVVVTTGLSAQGFVESVSAEGDLEAGDLVVVGQSSGGSGAGASQESEDEDAAA